MPPNPLPSGRLEGDPHGSPKRHFASELTCRNFSPLESVPVAQVPTHVTLVANTATTITVDGQLSSLHLVCSPSSAVAYARGDGGTAVVAADLTWPVFPSPADDTCVTTAFGATSTSISVISTGTPTVSVLPCDCD